MDMRRLRRWLLIAVFHAAGGCSMLPHVAYEPQVCNPYPQLSKVAVAPFFNLSTHEFVNGRQFALAYYGELQQVPGYEVVPVGVVERAIAEYQLSLDNPDDARRLAQILAVDAVVVGAITDYDPYYPPRCALKVEWYSVNPYFHSIPPGYGLPLGTPAQEQIPQRLIYEAELAQARASLASQAPAYDELPIERPPQRLPDAMPAEEIRRLAGASGRDRQKSLDDGPSTETLPPPQPDGIASPLIAPACTASNMPVMQHVAAYHGHDEHFVYLLQNYIAFRHDARQGDWKAYLQRSDDFIRFCCYLHIQQMLSARGGAVPTRVVWHWPDSR